MKHMKISRYLEPTYHACPMINLVQKIIELHGVFNVPLRERTREHLRELTEAIRTISANNRGDKKEAARVLKRIHHKSDVTDFEVENVINELYDPFASTKYVSWEDNDLVERFVTGTTSLESFLTLLEGVMERFHNSLSKQGNPSEEYKKYIAKKV